MAFGVTFSLRRDLTPEEFSAFMYGALGGLPPKRSWWHRFLIRLGFQPRGPYTHTFTTRP